jgi:CelD/BcsL family acetyltransferase involved in cellulose biosynthesis
MFAPSSTRSLEMGSIRTLAIGAAADLRAHRAAWDDLALSAIDANVFYHFHHFLAAWETLGRCADIHVLLVFARVHSSTEKLVAFFPLEMTRRRLPFRSARFWKHSQCFHGAPLIRRGFAGAALGALLQWLRSVPRGPTVLEAKTFPGDGPLYVGLVETLHAERLPWFVRDMYTRAVLRPEACAESYLSDVLSKSKRKKLRQSAARLAELGRVEFVPLDENADIDVFVEEFLCLESSGWKREAGTALACEPAARDYFKAAVPAAHRDGMIHGLSLRLDGKPVAMICDFRLGGALFGYKTAYNEAFAKSSPGLMLEIENLRRLLEQPTISTADSCSAPGAAILKDLWPERRLIVDLVIGIGHAPGNLLVSLLPLARWGKRFLFPGKRQPAQPATPANEDSKADPHTFFETPAAF